MSTRRIVDTNLIVRHLVKDHEQHAKAAARLFEACDRGDLTLVILPVVLSECVFVLESFYKHPRANIAKVMGLLLKSPGIELSDLSIHLDALDRYGSSKVHFVDCTVAAMSVAIHLSVASFDSDYRKFQDVQVDLT